MSNITATSLCVGGHQLCPRPRHLCPESRQKNFDNVVLRLEFSSMAWKLKLCSIHSSPILSPKVL